MTNIIANKQYSKGFRDGRITRRSMPKSACRIENFSLKLLVA
jgi:hypothetical protein